MIDLNNYINTTFIYLRKEITVIDSVNLSIYDPTDIFQKDPYVININDLHSIEYTILKKLFYKHDLETLLK